MRISDWSSDVCSSDLPAVDPRRRLDRRRRRPVGRRRRVAAALKDSLPCGRQGRGQELPVLYRDEFLAVVDKPAGLMVHDSKLARGESDFAADRLREQFGRKIFLVPRLANGRASCGGRGGQYGEV